MKNRITITALMLTLATFIISAPALAQDVGPYFSLSIGQSDVDLPYFDKGTSFSFGLGYSVSRNVAIDLSYINFGDSEDGIPPVWTLSADALVASFVGKIPFNNNVSGYGKIGLAAWDIELEEEGFGTFATDDGTDLTVGFGLLFTANQQLSGFIQYQMYELGDADIDNMSIGVQFGF